MPAKSKVQDTAEVMRWMEEGRTYQWMVEEYRRKYHIETTISMWSAWRHRNGLGRRTTPADALVPWDVRPEHTASHSINMLRTVARLRDGKDLSPYMRDVVRGWLRNLERDEVVVDYNPEQGFHNVPRLDSDTDIIRQPARVMRKRVARE